MSQIIKRIRQKDNNYSCEGCIYYNADCDGSDEYGTFNPPKPCSEKGINYVFNRLNLNSTKLKEQESSL